MKVTIDLPVEIEFAVVEEKAEIDTHYGIKKETELICGDILSVYVNDVLVEIHQSDWARFQDAVNEDYKKWRNGE